jgi:outer membrane receptor protein involved in Fe transport
VIIDRNDNYRAAATLTKISGNHTFKFGGEFMRMTHNYAQSNNPNGTFSLNPDLTAENAINTAGSGLGLASFLLRYPSSGNASSPALIAGQQFYPALFVNDDWHVTPKLTLNIGVRWSTQDPGRSGSIGCRISMRCRTTQCWRRPVSMCQATSIS